MEDKQSYRYTVKNDTMVLMNNQDEYEWVYKVLLEEVQARMGRGIFDYMLEVNNNRVYVKQDNTKPQVITNPMQLEELSEIAKSLGIVPEDLELKEYFFHVVDTNGEQHGFDVRDFESRSITILDSFADIIDKNFKCDQAIIPIKLPTYLSSSLCDAFILVFIKQDKPAEGELIDFAHPDYVKFNQRTTWVTKLP